MEPLQINMVILSESITARLRGAKRDLQLPLLLYAAMCTRPILAWSSHFHPALVPLLKLMPSDNIVSGHIPLGHQTLLKECSCSYVVTKIGILKNIRAYRRSHLVSNSCRSHIVITTSLFNEVMLLLQFFSINLVGIISTSTVHQGFYLIADVTVFTVLFYFIHHFWGYTIQTLTESLWGADHLVFKQWSSCVWTKCPLVHSPSKNTP